MNNLKKNKKIIHNIKQINHQLARSTNRNNNTHNQIYKIKILIKQNIILEKKPLSIMLPVVVFITSHKIHTQ